MHRGWQLASGSAFLPLGHDSFRILPSKDYSITFALRDNHPSDPQHRKQPNLLDVLRLVLHIPHHGTLTSLYAQNFNFGITEHEVQNWMMLQYLMRVPAREFMNSCNNGLMHAFVESGFAMMGISGFEAELYDGRKDAQERENEPLREEIGVSESSALGFPEVQDGIKYVVNWAKAIMVVIPQMPNNPIRKDIIKLMKTD